MYLCSRKTININTKTIMTFRLREILLARNIPFNTFAARINMAPSSLAVTDKSLPTLANVQIYADALGMPSWELVYDCGLQAPTPYARPADSFPLDDVVVNRVMALLQEKGMSMRRLAINMDVTAAALTQAFKRKKMGLKLVEKMAAGLGVETWQLLATPEEVRDEVLRRKAALGIEEEPEPTPEAPSPSVNSGRYVAIPLLPNGSPDLSKLEWIDTPEGRVLVWPMSEVRIIDVPSEGVEDAAEDEDTILLTEDR